MFLLAELLGIGFFGGGGFDRLGLVWAGPAVDITSLDFDIGVFAQLGEICAEGGLKLLVVESVLHLGEDVLERRNAGLLVIYDLQDTVTLLEAHHLSDFAGLHSKSLVLDFLCQLAALEHAERAAIRGGWTVGIFLGDIFEIGTVMNLLKKVVGFGLSGTQSCGFGSLPGSGVLDWSGGISRGNARRRSRGQALGVTRISLKRMYSGCSISALCSS